MTTPGFPLFSGPRRPGSAVSSSATLAQVMRILLHDDPAAFETLAAEWRELAAGDPSAGVFHTPQYLATWWAEFADSLALTVVEVRDGPALRGIAALALAPDGTLRFLGDSATTDYLGPVAAGEDREMIAGVVLEEASRLDWNTFQLDGLAADSGWAEAFVGAAKASGFLVDEHAQDACPRVTIPGTYEDYLSLLPAKLRHEILRKARRLERDAGPFEVRLSTEAGLDDDLERFFSMHRSSDGPKGRFMHEGMAAFFGGFAWMLFSQGWLRLAFLEVNGEAWAGAYCYAHRDVWGVWNSAYDHRRRQHGPGMVLVGECLRLAAAEGCGSFDFLRGTEGYKYRFGAVDVPLVQLVVSRE